MTERTGYANGEPCWADVTVPDLDAARDFYGGLFGWTFVDTGPEFGGYTRCQLAGADVAGLTPPMPGTPALPLWNVYLWSDDIARTAALAEEAGAKIMAGPMEVSNNGTMLTGFDPTGAPFGVWQPGQMRGAQRADEPNAMCWAEVYTRDAQTADAFYRTLFGYEQQQIGDGITFDYTTWSLGGRAVAGRMLLTEEQADVPPHWLVYVRVTDVDSASVTADQLGGEVLLGPQDTTYGRMATVADPFGAQFAIIVPAQT